MKYSILVGAMFLVFGILILISNLFSFAKFTGTLLSIIGILVITVALEENIKGLVRRKDIEDLKKDIEEAKKDIKEIKAEIIKNQKIYSQILDYLKDRDNAKKQRE